MENGLAANQIAQGLDEEAEPTLVEAFAIDLRTPCRTQMRAPFG